MTAVPAPVISQLGRYQLSRVLGQGAMGVVYEGLDPLLNRQVAVKTILRSALLDADTLSDSSTRFVREAQAIARLNHPNIVAVFDFGEEGDVAYFVMEFIRGRELKNHFDEGTVFSVDESLRIVGELLAALEFAHRQGVIHRDVKPANVMLDEARRVKLTDFGVARLADASGERTMAGTMVGTPSYMSPEQIQGLAVGSRTDLFAVGIILYQFLTGSKPFPGPGAWTVQKQIVHDDQLPPSLANAQIDPLFDAIVARALAKDPALRYADATEFATALQQARRLINEQNASPASGAQAVFSGSDETRISTTAARPAQHLAQSEVTRAPAIPENELTVLPGPSNTSPPDASEGLSTRQLLTAVAASLAVVLFAFIAFSLQQTAPRPGDRTTTQSGVPPSTVAVPTPVAAPTEAGLPATTSPASPAPVAIAKTAPAPIPATAKPTAQTGGTEAVAWPVRRDTEAVKPTVKSEAAPSASPKARSVAGQPSSSQRCDDLMQRFQLGEGLSSDDLIVLQKECRK